MAQWRKVRVGAITYRIVLVTVEEYPSIEGKDAETDFEHATIRIRRDIAPERFAGALLHELLHACLEASTAHTQLERIGRKRWNAAAEEDIVRAIESTLTGPLVQLGWRPAPRLRKPKAE